jgi:chemosensory pili system protein ChpA (sensor histidine kinase/response regulator)
MKDEVDAVAEAPHPLAHQSVGRHSSPRSEISTVVLVDDDTDTREQLTELLEDQGYRVLTAHDGADALEKLMRAALPQLIILDLNMPGLNGADFAHRLLHNPTFGRVPVLVVSGSATGRQQAALLGADAFLEKPLRCADLLEQVSQLVEGRLQCT